MKVFCQIMNGEPLFSKNQEIKKDHKLLCIENLWYSNQRTELITQNHNLSKKKKN